jgi:tRNA-5-taurinomethyluridine 2-sulfurtransferase
MLFLFLRRNRRLQTSSVSFDEKTNRTFWEEKNHHRQLYAQLPERIKRAVLAQIPRDLLASSKTNKKTVVAVALSGGVDSFVSAWLLKNALQAAAVGEKGENIKLKAILMKNWDEREETNSECLFDADRRSAKKLAKYLSMDLYEVDFCREYWQSVFSPFTESVGRGETPNPDVWCNREIKFGKLLEYVKEEEIGAKYLVTGHYAEIWREYGDDNIEQSSSSSSSLKRIELRRSKDETKDQTYFLASVPSKALESVIFPLAKLRKAEDVIELIARDLLGNVANVLDRKSSAGICFVGKKRNFSDFVHEYVQRDPAWFVDVECITEENSSLIEKNSIGCSSNSSSSSSNRSSSSSGISSGGSERGGLEGKGDSNTIDEKYILGECESVHSVTAGQRARIGGLPKPYFVVGKSTEEKGSSKVYVCEGGDHPALLTNWCVIKDIRFVHEDDTDALNSSQQVRVKTRYASPLVPATIGIPPPPSNAASSSSRQQQQQQKVSLFCRSAYEKATTTPSPSSPSTTAKSSSPSSSSPPLLQITFASPEKAVSIGQAVVMYHHSTSRVLGVGSVAYHGRTVFEEEKEEEQQRRQKRQSEKKNDDDKES